MTMTRAATFRKVELALRKEQVVVIVSRQLVEQHRDWTPIKPPEGLSGIEAKFVGTDDPNVVDLQARYV